MIFSSSPCSSIGINLTSKIERRNGVTVSRHTDTHIYNIYSSFVAQKRFRKGHSPLQRDAPCIAPRRSLPSKVTHGADQDDASHVPRRRSEVVLMSIHS